MNIIWPLISILLVIEQVFAGYFNGGIIRWMPLTKNATVSPVQVMIIQTYTYTLSEINCSVGSLIDLNYTYGFNFSLWCTLNCGITSAGYYAPSILTYCTGENAALDIAFTQRTDIVNLTANDYFSISYAILNTTNNGFYRPLVLSTGENDTESQWSITTSIDIRPRPDNGLINTPPIANIMSPYGIPYNIPTQIVIRTVDIDNDDVRCRWGNSSLECGDVCFPRTIPTATTLSSDCILTITGLKVNNWYCAPIQVEDFLNKTTSTSFSSVPLQFLIYVYQPKNCSIPTLSSPLSCIGVQVGVPYIFTLTAIDQCGPSSNISDIVIQNFDGITEGPLVQINSNSNTTIYAMNVTYTPLPSQIGLQAICATALDNDNIPSDQLCITFIVDNTTVPLCPGITTATTISPTPISSNQLSMVTSQNISMTSSMILLTTQTSSKSDSINGPLIGTLVALSTLLTLCCCWCCYHCLLGAASRRRRRKKIKRKPQSTNADIHTERFDRTITQPAPNIDQSFSDISNCTHEKQNDETETSFNDFRSSTQTDRTNISQSITKVTRVSSINIQSTTNNSLHKNKMKSLRRYNSANLTRISNNN